MLTRSIIATLLCSPRRSVSAQPRGPRSRRPATGVSDTATPALPSVDDRVAVPNPAVLEQQQAAWEQLLDHHTRTVHQREVVQQNTWENHERVSEALGPRAPKHTPPPMPTVPPLER